MNVVILKGNLTKDPELKYTNSGTAIAKISLAVNRKWKNSDGELQEEVSFFDGVSFNRQAEVIAEHMKKGSPILLQGRLKQDRWETDQGEKRSKVEIVIDRIEFIGKKGESDE